MNLKNTYSRKISSKEAEKSFILILKSELSFFPELGETFKLIENDLSRKVKVNSHPCTCRGPDKPHEHYFICWKELEAGNNIEITKDSENRYNLQIHR